MTRDCALLLLGLILGGPEPPVFTNAVSRPQTRSEMPSYRGRSLDSWLKDLVCTPCGPEYEPAADAIRAMGEDSIPYLLQRIKYGPPDNLAVTAIGILGQRASSAVPQLTEFYRREPTSLSAAMALVSLSAEKPVIEALSSGVPTVRERAISALGYGGHQVDPAAVPALIAILENPSIQTRSSVIWALWAIHKRDDLVVPALLPLLDDQNPWIRQSALAGLRGFNLLQISDAVIKALDDLDAGVRQAAVGCLQEGVDRTTGEALIKKIVAALILRLNDPVDGMRKGAARALGRIGPRAMEAIAPLTELTQDGNSDVREAATAALGGIKDTTRY